MKMKISHILVSIDDEDEINEAIKNGYEIKQYVSNVYDSNTYSGIVIETDVCAVMVKIDG